MQYTEKNLSKHVTDFDQVLKLLSFYTLKTFRDSKTIGWINL